MRNRWLELSVGFFILFAVCGLLFLAFKVSGLTQLNQENYYSLKADFDNIGGLLVRAPVSMSGVTIGRVSAIQLDPKTYRAQVTMQIKDHYNNLPSDTVASIYTQGLLGSNYISLTPGFDQTLLQNNGRIETTHSALVLENLIGQLMFNLANNKNNNSSQPVLSKNKRKQ